MNKISVVGDLVTLNENDNLINVKFLNKEDTFDVIKINIEVLKNTDIEITYDKYNDTKLEINYNVLENVILNINEINEAKNIKISNNFYIKENSKVFINKFYDNFCVKQLDIINLDGENAEVLYNLKTISKDIQKFDIFVYHNCNATLSNIITKSANIDLGSTNFNINSTVPKNIKGCTINQNNRIITFNDKKCVITPKLLIDEQDVTANHSALIGTFDEESLFYLMSRGISKKDALNLLIKGFLMDNENEKINTIIDKYWR